MVKQYKIDEVNNLVSILEERKNFILTDYSGVKVKELGDLRSKLREKNSVYKVVKNNLFLRALQEKGIEGFEEHLKGPIGVAFAAEEIGEVAKVLKEFSKEVDSFSFSMGMMDDTTYGEDDIKMIADLPSKEVVLGQVLSLINAPSTKVAMGINQVMASLARGIQAVAEKNNQ